MQVLNQLARHRAPALRPQPLTFHDGLLWLACWDDPQLFAIDPATWSIRESAALAGRPYGLAALDGALHLVISLGDDDDRYLETYVPGKGLDETARVPCPEMTGSHLTSDGTSLYLVQQTHRRLLELGTGGSVRRTIDLPARCAGICAAAGAWSYIEADAEFDVLHFATLELAGETASVVTLAPIDENARGLAFDGNAFWTSYRELGEVVSFVPERQGAGAS